MEPSYRIETDPKRHLMQLSFSGQWTPATIAAFQSEVDQALADMTRAGMPAGGLLTLIDMREQAVQPQDVVGGMEGMASKYSPLSKRIAVVLSDSILQKMQVKRISADVPHRFFSDREKAVQWIIDPTSVD